MYSSIRAHNDGGDFLIMISRYSTNGDQEFGTKTLWSAEAKVYKERQWHMIQMNNAPLNADLRLDASFALGDVR